ncbi:hypothetical protein AVEN_176501-1, partial [Araneus ventricosus]
STYRTISYRQDRPLSDVARSAAYRCHFLPRHSLADFHLRRETSGLFRRAPGHRC